jgi:hypothetical protein
MECPCHRESGDTTLMNYHKCDGVEKADKRFDPIQLSKEYFDINSTYDITKGLSVFALFRIFGGRGCVWCVVP